MNDVFDPQANVTGGSRYLRELLERYNFDLVKALAAYNAGPQRVEQYQGVPPFRETRAYVARIVHEYNIKKTAQAKETVLYSFAGAPSDGANPWVTPVFDKKGNLYGATVGGGAYNYGTVFEVTPSHGKWTRRFSTASTRMGRMGGFPPPA